MSGKKPVRKCGKNMIELSRVNMVSTVIFVVVIRQTFDYIKGFQDYEKKQKIRNGLFLASFYITLFIEMLYRMKKINDPFYYISLGIVFLYDLTVFIIFEKIK